MKRERHVTAPNRTGGRRQAPCSEPRCLHQSTGRRDLSHGDVGRAGVKRSAAPAPPPHSVSSVGRRERRSERPEQLLSSKEERPEGKHVGKRGGRTVRERSRPHIWEKQRTKVQNDQARESCSSPIHGTHYLREQAPEACSAKPRHPGDASAIRATRPPSQCAGAKMAPVTRPPSQCACANMAPEACSAKPRHPAMRPPPQCNASAFRVTRPPSQCAGACSAAAVVSDSVRPHGLYPPGSRSMRFSRILEWAAMPSPRGSPRPGDRTHASQVCCTGRPGLCHQRCLGSSHGARI